MKLKILYSLLFFIFHFSGQLFAQNVSLYQQFSGRFDFTFAGNTLNPDENTSYYPSFINTSSSADLMLQSSDVIEAAYLYWAGCGPGDFNIKLNNIDIEAQRTFSTIQASSGKTFFAAFHDITDLVTTQGSTTYTLSELDVNDQIPRYWNNGTHFAGWAILVVYRNDSLPLNVVNVYDGLESLSTTLSGGIGELNITIDNLNVIDDVGSKIGFIAWEGDRGIPAPGSNIIESLSINGITVGNPPLNPANNAFNGTNSVTGAQNLYNMDLDIYNIQNYITIGDDTATIQLATGQDYVMINAIVTKLNSQLPDATVNIDDYGVECNSRNVSITYTVSNLNATDFLPAGTTVSIYADGVLVGTNQTQNDIPIGESETLSQFITIPNGIPITFNLEIIVDQPGLVTELVENNNNAFQTATFMTGPTPNLLEDLVSCNRGLTEGLFDFSSYETTVTSAPNQTVTFHESLDDATSGSNPIADPSNYIALTTPKRIFVRIDGPECFTTTSFLLTVKPCPPIVYNAVSVNGDGLNDTFHIEGLLGVFLNFELYVYNRWGKEIWKGNNYTPEWDGYVKDGIGNAQAPDGTYFYILYLNDPDYPKPLNGYLYLNH